MTNNILLFLIILFLSIAFMLFCIVENYFYQLTTHSFSIKFIICYFAINCIWLANECVFIYLQNN